MKTKSVTMGVKEIGCEKSQSFTYWGNQPNDVQGIFNLEDKQ